MQAIVTILGTDEACMPEGDKESSDDGNPQHCHRPCLDSLSDSDALEDVHPQLPNVQLTLLFLVGTIVVVVTIIRLPLIFLHSNSQTTRTMWASIELVCASIVGNAAFYYALWKEIPRWRGQRPSSVPLVPYILSLEHNGSENQRAWTCPEQRLIQASTSDKTDDTSAGTPKDTLSLVETGLKGLHGST
ncbi:hypothetical protein DIZ76_017278 [Coccidioides immitis]|nr:hypothetical protein DIZ76_017278 [Coccidioides immitis]